MDHKDQNIQERLAAVVAEAAKNETILRRAQDRELVLLESASLEELFANLVTGLKQSFGLSNTSVVLWDPEHEVRHLLLFSNLENPQPEGVLFCDNLGDLSPLYSQLKGPVLGPYVGKHHGRLFTGDSVPASVAMLPLRRNTQLIGSLNLGSSDAKRFTRYHATDFLHHLATISAFCLENNINRSKLIWTGLTDVLTGWHNRRYLEARLPEEFAAAARRGDTVSVLLFDIDHFKTVNDSYGHAAGDQVLREIAQRVQREIRLSDVAARYGGEEFVVLLPQTGLAEAKLLAERIRQAVCATPIRIRDQTANVMTISIGLACANPSSDERNHSLQSASALDQADQAMYAAKSGGRNQVRVFKLSDKESR